MSLYLEPSCPLLVAIPRHPMLPLYSQFPALLCPPVSADLPTAFLKLSYFLPNSHKKSPNLHRSSVRTNVINRGHHSEHICGYCVVFRNSTKQLRGGTRISPTCSCHSMAIPSIPALWPPAISASSQEEWFDSQSTSPGAWNTSQRSTITLNFNKVLLLQMKTIPFQYCLSSCTGRLVYIPACSTLCQEIVPAKLIHKHLSQRICLLIGFIRTPQRHTLGTELGQHRRGIEQSRQRGGHSHPSSSSYYLFKSNSIMLGNVPAEPQTLT